MWFFVLGGIVAGLTGGLLKGHLLSVAFGALVLAALQTWWFWRDLERANATAEAFGRDVAPRREQLLRFGYSAGIFVVMAMGIVFATYAVVRRVHG
jgi:hypothetical protein